MLEKIRMAVLMLLGVFCITAYVVIVTSSTPSSEGTRQIASEPEPIIQY